MDHFFVLMPVITRVCLSYSVLSDVYSLQPLGHLLGKN